jgi:YD repeat-containing protein
MTLSAWDRLSTITGMLSHPAEYSSDHDRANRVTTEVNAEGTATFSYDSGGELLTVRGSRTENYTYDSGGNRNMSGYTTGTGNELSSGGGYTFTYDNEGNMIGQTQLSTGNVWRFGYEESHEEHLSEFGRFHPARLRPRRHLSASGERARPHGRHR